MNIAICDDLKEALEDTRNVLRQIHYVKNIDLFSNIEYLYEDISEGKHYDAVLMDIDWKIDKSGIDFAEELQKYSPYTKIIYVTAYTLDYIEDVFLKSSNLSGFLMKPVNLEQLQKNLDKIRRNQGNREGQLVVRYKGGIQVIPFEEIQYMESRLHKVNIHTKTKICECGARLNNIENSLDERFLRCHQSYIVNMDTISEFQGKELILKNGTIIPVSKNRNAATKSKFIGYLAEKM